MIPSIAVRIRKELCRFGRLKFNLILAIEAFGEVLNVDVELLETVYFRSSWRKVQRPVMCLKKLGHVTSDIKNTLYMRYDWEFKRCVFLQLNIIRCSCDDKEPLASCEMTTRIVNKTPRLYDQAIKHMPLYVLKLLNSKPDFIIQELQLIM